MARERTYSPQGGFERRPPLQHGQQEQPKPNRARGQQRPFVQGQPPEPALPSPGRQGRAWRLVPRKLQVGAQVRVARGDLLRRPVGGDGAANLAGLEERIAEIEVEGGGSLPGPGQCLVSGSGLGELAFLIELVGGVEGRGGNRRLVIAQGARTLASNTSAARRWCPAADEPRHRRREPARFAPLDSGRHRSSHGFSPCSSRRMASNLGIIAANSWLVLIGA